MTMTIIYFSALINKFLAYNVLKVELKFFFLADWIQERNRKDYE